MISKVPIFRDLYQFVVDRVAPEKLIAYQSATTFIFLGVNWWLSYE